MDPETFAQHFDGKYDAILRQARELRARMDAPDPLEIRALVPTGPGELAELHWREGAWWLARTAPVRGAQESPQQTLDAFRAAIDSRNLDAALALLSSETRARYLAELDAIGAALAEGEASVIASGDVAVVLLQNGDQLHLVREDGVWRVERIQQSGE
jgi:hypothetical protein